MKLMQINTFFAKLAPENSGSFKKIFENISWLFLDKVVRMFVSLFIGVWIARYFGPTQFGVFSYAMALVAVFTSVASLGLQGVVVRDIVLDPNSTGETLGTSASLQVVAGIISYLALLILAFIVHADEPVIKMAISILGISLLFKASETIKYRFESLVLSKYVVWTEITAITSAAAGKIVLILIEAPLMAFIVIAVIESALIALGLIFSIRKNRNFSAQWTYNSQRAKNLIISSWPLMLSGLAIMIYMRIDQIMLHRMTDSTTVGLYSVAIKLSEVWYFIPVIIVASIFPSIIETKKQSNEAYLGRLQKLFKLMLLLAMCVAIPTTLFADWAVELIFGMEYRAAAPILVIHIWASIFVFMGVAGGQWLVLENLQIFSLERTLLGAISNISLNLLFIPDHGGVGAAIASLISYAVSGLFSDLLHKKTRPMFLMKLGFWPSK